MTDNEIENLIAKWERLEKLASDHQRAARECKILSKAWKRDSPATSALYGELDLMHSKQSTQNSAAATMLRDKLEIALTKTIPEGAERTALYLAVVGDGTCLTYDQYLGIVEEQEAEAQEASKPIDASEDDSPF